MKCAHCGDPAWTAMASTVRRLRAAEHAKHLIPFGEIYYLAGRRAEPCCMGCWRELFLGYIPPLDPVRQSGSIRSSNIREPSPSDENAVRTLEDHNS